MSNFGGADLHCHSVCSDGVETPAQLVSRALEAGLSVLALSDHDAVHGLPEFEAAARGTGLGTVAGTELSTHCDGDDVHVLGLFVDPEEPELVGKLAHFRKERDTRGELMVQRLEAAGYRLDLEAIRKVVGDGAFGRPHVARAMIEAGYVATLDEAFDRFLSRGRPGYAPKAKWSLEDAIRSIRKAGGLAVLAHPVWYKDPEKVVAEGIPAGLDGIEVFHADHLGQQENQFSVLAERNGLLKSAGSDYHGPPQGKRVVGAVRLDETLWKPLLAAAHVRRAEAGRPALSAF